MTPDEERDDRKTAGRDRSPPERGAASAPAPAPGTGTGIGKDTDILPPAPKDGLLDHFVKRTDTGFAGKTDKSLIGEDVGWAEDELDEDGEPLKP